MGRIILPMVVLLIFGFSRTGRAQPQWGSLDCTAAEDECSEEPTIFSPGEIYQMHVQSIVRNRFAHTTVISRIRNTNSAAKEIVFSMILPESAFISEFVMEVNGQNYTAYVKEKDEGRKLYEEARSSGLGAAHVAVDVRDSNKITVSVNVELQSEAVFYLTYEELLQRRDGHYEIVVNLYPGQFVRDLCVKVEISESIRIKDVKPLSLRTGNRINNSSLDLDPSALTKIDDDSAKVAFCPSLERQQQLAYSLETSKEEGLAGQFIVQYDVEREPNGGEVLIQDGYFVHFFSPSTLSPLSKYVIFILDTSSSMRGEKLNQLKEAMYKILSDLGSEDLFHIIEFNDNVTVRILNGPPDTVSYTDANPSKLVEDRELLEPYSVNPDNIERAKAAIYSIKARARTNIYLPLRIALDVVHLAKLSSTNNINHQPMIIFLTDGYPERGMTSTDEIVKEITRANMGLSKTPIFTLSFGRKASRSFLQQLSLKNFGFSRHIYEAADASLQLENFYREISSPLLSDITFKYEYSSRNITDTKFALHFGGTELVTAGRYDIMKPPKPVVKAWNGEEGVSFQPTVHQAVSNLERLWAYLTVKQLLQKSEGSGVDEAELRKRAIRLSLDHSFVTSVTSLVVVKPNKNIEVPVQAIADRTTPEVVIDISTVSTTSPPLRTRLEEEEINDDKLIQPIPHQSKTTVFELKLSQGQNDNLTQPLFRLKKENGILSLPQGQFKLGLNITLSDLIKCSNSLLNSEGHCRLLHSCLTDSLAIRTDVYLNHFCTLRDEYAGICCPDSWYKEN